MERCACTGAFLERFIQPSILMYLNDGGLHGFLLLKKLRESDDVDYSGIDPTGLYRMLKKMEKAGLLTSEWDVEGSSQPRRIYSITEEGRVCLSYWEKTLKEYTDTIGKLSKAVSKSLVSKTASRSIQDRKKM